MYKYGFLEKRSQNGEILKFEHKIYNKKITEKYFNLISNSKIYQLLCEKFPKRYIDSYFKKDFFYELIPISGQIIIHKQENKKNTNYKLNINTQLFSYNKLLSFIIDNENNLIFKSQKSLKNIKKNFINIIKPIYHALLNLKIIFTKKKIHNFLGNKNSIAVCYAEGISKTKRSDLFWLNNLDTKTNNIIVYVESPYLFRKHDEKEILEQLRKEKKITLVKIWELNKPKRNFFYKNIRKNISKVCDKSDLDKILLKKSFELLDKVEFWENFFKKFNVKIHMDPNERVVDVTAKQIAIFLAGGCSIGKNSSYLGNVEGLYYHYYPNDIFCCWGEKTLQDFKYSLQDKTATAVGNILTMGYPYDYFMNEEKIRINKIKQKLDNNGVRFVLLLLDNSAHHNKDHEQVLPFSVLENFYKFFLNWVIEDKEIGLIIKPKKLAYLKNLKSLTQLTKNSVATGRCCIVDEPEQPIPWHYSTISNMTVALSVNCIPTALISCLINNKKTRGIFFDYPNLRRIEADLYSWGENKVIFDNMNKMFQSLKEFKSQPSPSNDLGVWSNDYINKFDAFRDGKSSDRFNNYINSLLKGFDAGLDKTKAISAANEVFSTKWGSDKVLTLDN